MMPDHTRQAPLLSHDAMSLWGPGSMHRDTTAPSCPAHCTPAAHQAESVVQKTCWHPLIGEVWIVTSPNRVIV